MRISAKSKPYRELQSGTVHHIISTGQSLSVGASATSTLSTTQPYSNLKFDDNGVAFEALTEPIYRENPANDNSVETIHSGMANLWSELVNAANPDAHVVLNSCAGWGAAGMDDIKKGGALDSYGRALEEVHAAMRLCTGTYTVDAICLLHGESDHNSGTTEAAYESFISTLQSDFDTDIKAITGQAATIPLFLCQLASWTTYGDTTSVIPKAQWDVSKSAANVYMVCPKYFLPYDANGRHLTATGYRQLGEYYARAIDTVVTDGGTWTPLQPATCTRATNVITLTFDIPGTALVLDTTNVSDPGNYGFEYTDNGDGNSVTISSVALANANTEVQITLSDTPTGTGQTVRYAWTGTAGNDAGPTTGPRGCLRDNDTSVTSRHGYDLYNWCVVFEMAVS